MYAHVSSKYRLDPATFNQTSRVIGGLGIQFHGGPMPFARRLWESHVRSAVPHGVTCHAHEARVPGSRKTAVPHWDPEPDDSMPESDHVFREPAAGCIM